MTLLSPPPFAHVATQPGDLSVDAVIQEAPTILGAFLISIELFALAAVGSLLLGSVVATMAISPVPPLRWLAALYVRLVRNTPLTAVFFLIVFGLPQVGIRLPFFTFAVMALTFYTATFVAETLRSGIRAIPKGQIEAARSIGMPFGKVLRHIVLPQAFRSVVPPLTSLMISLFKNTSIASAFGVAEAIGTMTSLVNIHSSAVLWIMMTVLLMYVFIALAMGRASQWLERKVVVLR